MDIETCAVLENTLRLFNMFNSWSVRLCDQGIQYHLGDSRYITLFSFSKQSVWTDNEHVSFEGLCRMDNCSNYIKDSY